MNKQLLSNINLYTCRKSQLVKVNFSLPEINTLVDSLEEKLEN